ncbi:hypothetical protein TRFO_20215 [Tritrichomonas foetus]|uniref:Uncharacterized protein n=1 Tax=Tritrichomonas foetus TaxID=1144522 RepID=A0A1J4KGH2_9EUKA|nr:hypothetical protein TRFO_20215 [Tritrichomonas foetus]|eukprot:OHT10473.1 hypothetical protein TRFO_20215 [Tritrichomonas foetus]
MLPTPDFLSLLPADMKNSSGELCSILSSYPQNVSTTNFFTALMNIEIPNKSKPVLLRRVPKRKATDPAPITSTILTQYYLPDVYFPSKIQKKAGLKELANRVAKTSEKSKKKKQVDQFGLKTSYRKLPILHPLESHIESHFILNHKFKILMFGCVGSVGHVSDDEGSESRNGNPLYNIDIVNKSFDELADEDILSYIQIIQYLNTIIQERHKAQQLRKTSMLNPSILNSILVDRHMFLNKLLEYTDELNHFPIMKPIDFNCEEVEPIPFLEFALIVSILMNIEDVSKSLRIGNEIHTNLNAYRLLVRSAMKNDFTVDYHLICDPIFAKFIFVSHEIINSLLTTFKLPQNWKFALLVKFFTEKKICLTDVLDELTAELAKSIDNGSWYAREMLKYRELACIVEMHSFQHLVHDECEKYSQNKKGNLNEMMKIARGYSPYNELIGIKIIFTKKGEILVTQEKIQASEQQCLFPVFNMFDGISTIDDASFASILY